jgi:ACS family tartrate transporter-like MFS transporter
MRSTGGKRDTSVSAADANPIDDRDRLIAKKVAWRLVPLLMLCYFVAFLDRVNVGFAALTMNADLGFDSAVFGLGAGIFFIGYFLFEVPSNLVLEKLGARRWIARIMFSWGLVSAAMALVWNEPSFYAGRFLLGAAEAGFFPGVVLYLTYWFTAEHRARMVGLFMAAVPVSGVIGSPLSGSILGLEGALGLHGWQWLFILEGLPSMLLSVAVWRWLTNGPSEAGWLTDGERAWLKTTLERERALRDSVRKYRLGEALTDGRVLALSVLYLGLVTGLYGVTFWLPQIVKGFGGLSNVEVGFIAALPTLAAAIAMVAWTRHSDRTRERPWHVALPAFAGGAGLIASAYMSDPILSTIALSVALIGIYAAIATSWTLPTAFLTGTAAAGGLALINSIGNLGGFAGPYFMGWIKNATGAYSLALLGIGLALAVSGVIALAMRRAVANEHPAGAPIQDQVARSMG